MKDGDTIVVLAGSAANPRPITVRLRGIDCPEKRQAFGQQAKQFTSAEVFGKEVKVETFGTERWGRTIGEVFVGHRDLSIDLLKVGLAWVYTRYAKGLGWARYEYAARAEKRGLWADQDPVPPWEFRHLDDRHYVTY